MHTTPDRTPHPSTLSALARPVALLALVLVATGCHSFATRGSARTMKAGEWELEAGISGVPTNPMSRPSSDGYDGQFDTNDWDESTGDDAYALVEVGVGVGLTDSLELGGRLRIPGGHDLFDNASEYLLPALALDTKLQLTREDEQGNGLDVAVDPTVTVAVNSDRGAKGLTSSLQLPLLMGFNLSERDQLLLSPQLTVSMPHLGFTSRQLLPSLGLAYLHRFESGWGLRPEFTVIAPPDAEGNPFQTVTFQAGFSLLKR